MGLRFDPMGGGKFQGLLQEIIKQERQPIRSLEQRKEIEDKKVKLFNEFKGSFGGLKTALDEINNFNKLVEYKVDLGDGANLVDINVNKEKVKAGSYEIEINEMAQRSAMISNGFEDADAKNLGIGYIVVYNNQGEDFEIFVDEDKASLRGISQLINSSKNSPVNATVVKDAYNPDEPWRLILSAKNDGQEKGVEFPEFYFLGGKEDFWIDDDKESKNAFIKVNGFEVDLEGNDVPDFLEGVNLKIKGANPGKPFTVKITEDTEKVTGKVENVVNEMNKVLKFINEQNKVDKDSDTKSTFTGDTSLQAVEYRLRNLLHEGFSVYDPEKEDYHFVWLNQAGIEFGKDGLLQFKKDRFEDSIQKDFDGVAEAISGEFGFVNQMSELLAGYTRPGDGLLALRERTLKNRIDSLDRQIDNQERRVEQKTNHLVNKFSRLQGTLAQLQAQQQYVSASLGGGGGNVLEQLIGG